MEIQRNNQCTLWRKLREITSKTAERTKKSVTFPTKQDPAEAPFPKLVCKVNFNTHIIHNLSMTLSSSWVWIFKTGMLWVRKVKNYQSPKQVFYLVHSCSYKQLSPRNIKLYKNLSFKHHKLWRRSLWKDEIAFCTLLGFFVPGGRARADKLQWWKSPAFLASWEKIS